MKFGIVLKCIKCGHTEPLENQKLVATLQLQEWGILQDTGCDECGETGGLCVETTTGHKVESDFGDNLVMLKDDVEDMVKIGEDKCQKSLKSKEQIDETK